MKTTSLLTSLLTVLSLNVSAQELTSTKPSEPAGQRIQDQNMGTKISPDLARHRTATRSLNALTKIEGGAQKRMAPSQQKRAPHEKLKDGGAIGGG